MINTLSDKDARVLATRIVKEASDVRVKFGKTNGENVLHVFVPGSASLGRTIRNAAGWENHPANVKTSRKRNEEGEKLADA